MLAAVDIATDYLVFSSMTPEGKTTAAKQTLQTFAFLCYLYVFSIPTTVAIQFDVTGVSSGLLWALVAVSGVAAFTGLGMLYAQMPRLIMGSHYATLVVTIVLSIVILATAKFDGDYGIAPILYGFVVGACVVGSACQIFSHRVGTNKQSAGFQMQIL